MISALPGFDLDASSLPAIDAHPAAIDAGELDLALAPLISAWGRRPAGTRSRLRDEGCPLGA
jgi:hypothetical protein